ncbi:hypothetical protein Tco_0911586 [Tanacetum coccineum]|uniref:Transposase (Putative), gypsy type n=1 Tax=Tanacetum coccineum TaxID=301880 RepID=A0ABQ5CW63_9ASTR
MSTISQEYLLEFTSEYGIAEDLHPDLPSLEERIMDFPKGKVDMDLFNLIRAPNPTKVKTGTRPRAAHEVPLLTITTSRVIDMEDPAAATKSSETPSTIEKSPLDFANENPSQQITEGDRTEDQSLEKKVAAIGPLVSKKHRKKGNDKADANAPPKVLRKDHAASCPTKSTVGEKSIASMGLEAGTTFPAPTPQETPADVSDPDPLSSKGAVIAGNPDSEKSTSFTSLARSSGGIYQPRWGVTNNYFLDTPDVCQDVVDHIVLPGYFSELRHLPNDDFLSQYNINLARQVAMGSQLRLRFEQEMRNLNTLLEVEVDMKKATEAKNAELTKELESLSSFKEFKKYEDDKLEKRCAEIDARLDALSIDVDEELYPYMLTAIAGHRWLIRHGLHLTVMKCAQSIELRQAFANVVSAGIAKGVSEGLEYGVKQGEAKLDIAAIEAYEPDADEKYVVALHALKDIKYPLVDQLEKLKDAPLDLIMASLYLESDTREDAPQWIRELRPSSS